MSKTAFISYSWDDDAHKKWVANLATRLRQDGVDVKLDQWHAAPGDQLPAFMEKEIRQNDYVIIICTPKYKKKTDERKGGVGYEGDIMTAEVHTQQNHRKFIPIIGRGKWTEVAPSWLAGKYYIDLSDDSAFEAQYRDLLSTIQGTRVQAPPLGIVKVARKTYSPSVSPAPLPNLSPIKIVGVIVDEVTEPTNDGTPGCALYRVPFRLSRAPSQMWIQFFLKEWQFPRQFTSMHRPGIASVRGDRIVLDGTTIEEVKRYHRDTLVLCVDAATAAEETHEKKIRAEKQREEEARALHKKRVHDEASGIQF